MRMSRFGVLVVVVMATAGQAFGVGIPISFDVNVYQSHPILGDTPVVQGSVGPFTQAELASGLSNQHFIGLANNGAPVRASVVISPQQADDPPGWLDVNNRWMRITLHTGNRNLGLPVWAGPSMLQELAPGKLNIEITNMVWSASTFPGVEPFHPSEYVDGTLPLYNMMGTAGFFDLPGSTDYPGDPSVQVSMAGWDNPANGYGFVRTAGVTSEVKLLDIVDPSGVGLGHLGAPDYVEIAPNPFARHPQGGPSPYDVYGNASVLEVSLNYRNWVPEPSTALLVLPGMLLIRRRRNAVI